MQQLLRVIILLVLNLAVSSVLAQDVESLIDTLKVTGSLDSRVVAYSSSGLTARRSPFSYILGGNINFSKGDFSLPLSITYSEQERKFSQPFNQFGIAPTYKWFSAYMGYQNLNWSSYTLAGHQMLGGGIELKPGKFLFSGFYGRLKRAVPFDSVKSKQQLPAYKRTGLALRTGYGSENNRVELTFIKASDDEKSLIANSDSSEIKTTPAQNSATSIKAKFQLFKGFSVFSEAALSVYTRNIKSPEFEEIEFPEFAKILLTPNLSTQIYTAINGGFNFQKNNFFMSGLFKRVAPDYLSMGAYFQENDIQSVSLNTGTQLWKGKGNLSAGVSQLKDNIQGKKAATTMRIIPMVNFTWNNFKHFGIDIMGTAVSTSQQNGTMNLSDTIRQNMLNPMISLTPRWTYADTSKVKSFFISILRQNLIDNNIFTKAFSQYQNTNLNVNYSTTTLKKFTTFFTSLNLNAMNTKANDIYLIGLQAGWTKGYKKNMFPVNISTGFSVSSQNKVINLTAGSSYHAKEKHHFSAMITAMQNISNIQGQANIREITGVVSYTYNFGK